MLDFRFLLRYFASTFFICPKIDSIFHNASPCSEVKNSCQYLVLRAFWKHFRFCSNETMRKSDVLMISSECNKSR